jgi:hypothetical protein
VSKASETFSQSMLDAEHLLKHFNELNTKPPPPDIEVLKRAGCPRHGDDCVGADCTLSACPPTQPGYGILLRSNRPCGDRRTQ